MRVPISKIQLESNQELELVFSKRVSIFEVKGNDNPKMVKVIEKVRKDSLLFTDCVKPVEVWFCWDGDCDVSEPTQEGVKKYVESFLKESDKDALEEADVIFFYPLFVGRNAYFVGAHFRPVIKTTKGGK